MPWLQLDFERRDIKVCKQHSQLRFSLPFAFQEALSNAFRVEGIPTLVWLDQRGQVLTLEGRKSVMQDPTGKNFPWKEAEKKTEGAAAGLNSQIELKKVSYVVVA